jgi:hypothetical protein
LENQPVRFEFCFLSRCGQAFKEQLGLAVKRAGERRLRFAIAGSDDCSHPVEIAGLFAPRCDLRGFADGRPDINSGFEEAEQEFNGATRGGRDYGELTRYSREE